MDQKSKTLADDILRGAPAIADFIGQTPKNTYYALENGLLPAGKEGGSWVASKEVISEHYRQLTTFPPRAIQEERSGNGLAPPRRGRPRNAAP